MKKTVLLSLGGLFLLALLVFGTGYALSYRIHAAALPALAVLTAPDGGAAAGETVQFGFELKLPLRTSLRAVEAELPDKLVLSGVPEIRRTGYFFTRMRYQVTVSAVVLEAGEIPEGKLRMLTDIPLHWTPAEVHTPAFTAARAEPAMQVLLADAMPIRGLPRSQYFWIGAAGLLALLAILAVWREKTGLRAGEKVLTIQEIAISEITELRRTMAARGNPESVFGRLSNVVRIYLERRFGLPLSRSTTEEFFAASARQKEKIPDAQRPFLAEFLRTADMVKFAKANAAPEAVRDALDSAEKLVRATTETGEEKQ